HRNPDHLVMTQRGPQGGVGLFVLMPTQDAEGGRFYFGYFITEDYKRPSEKELWLTQCPIVMLAKAEAMERYPTPAAAEKAFTFLRSGCAEFRMPVSVAEATR